MRTLYFDCFSGISGDMTVGALIDLGIDHEVFKKEMSKLNVHGLEFSVTKKTVNGISGTDFEVHEHSHGHGHEHKHERRHLKDIYEIIEKSAISDKAKNLSKKIFDLIATAEAKVHGMDVNEVHFHEVGALDSIADIIGTAICIDLLNVDRIVSSELHDGRGMIKCAHGLLPVPVPAVMEMLKGSDIPLVQEDIETELITPTGMAIISTLSEKYGKMPAMKILNAGFGFGKRDTGRLNALRVVLGDEQENSSECGIVTLETNIDDMTPEMLSFAMERLFEKGALDVYFTPVYMKKNRPGTMLTVICAPSSEAAVTECIFANTSTLGIRRNETARLCLERKISTMKTQFGEIRIKTAFLADGTKKASPEYEDCKKAALASGRPIKEIYDLVMNEYMKQ